MTQAKPKPSAPRRKVRANSPRELELKSKIALRNMEKRRWAEKADRAKLSEALSASGIWRPIIPGGRTIGGIVADDGEAEIEQQGGKDVARRDLTRQLDTYDGRFVLMMLFGNLPQVSDEVRGALGLPLRQRNGKLVAMTSRSIGMALARDARTGPDGGPTEAVPSEKSITDEGYVMRVDRQIELFRRYGLVDDDPEIERKDNLIPLRGTQKLFQLCLSWFGTVGPEEAGADNGGPAVRITAKTGHPKLD